MVGWELGERPDLLFDTGTVTTTSILRREIPEVDGAICFRGWETRIGWQPSPVDDGGQSSQDKWKKPVLQAKWKELSRTTE